ncbi:MAG: SUF system NifU family Fe-S cluster assembly protein [Bacilli bacterium]|jgi:nitrogen fixation NifU-like protein|nr:SUF system NifU family Fe-S cluster assembly protein [Bacilli bacterium]
MDQETKREIIMENYMHPTNRKRSDEESYKKTNTANSSCIDNIDIYVKFKDDKIEDITFEGEACAISISATSIMINNLIGKTKNEALKYIKEFYNMTDGNDFNAEVLNEAIVYNDIYKQGNRKTCATLPFRGIEKAILESMK